MVRSLLLSVLLVLGVSHQAVRANRDGFNMYKDYLRGKNEEIGDQLVLRDDVMPKFLYFYRAAPNLVLPVMGDLLQTSESINKKSLLYGKRSANQFKNYMLTREPPEMQFAADNIAAEIIKGLAESGRPIPVRTSIVAKREASPREEADVKRAPAIFSWSSPEPRLRGADLSDYYKMTTPRSTVALVERLNGRHN